jgi:hypothetical protein
LNMPVIVMLWLAAVKMAWLVPVARVVPAGRLLVAWRGVGGARAGVVAVPAGTGGCQTG